MARLPMLACLLTLLLGGCQQRVQMEPDQPLRLHGHFTYSFEVMRFVPCGSDEQWWVGQGASKLTDSLGGARFGTIYVELTGRVSPPGKYGHMGAYRRELSVEEVLLTDRPREDCTPSAD